MSGKQPKRAVIIWHSKLAENAPADELDVLDQAEWFRIGLCNLGYKVSVLPFTLNPVYARVDFRVDETGQPWVLEINANPCVSADSGFVAAAGVSGIGKALLGQAEREVKKRGGNKIYIETSSMEKYESTRRFYLRADYTREALLNDFYDRGDHKLIFSKFI